MLIERAVADSPTVVLFLSCRSRGRESAPPQIAYFVPRTQGKTTNEKSGGMQIPPLDRRYSFISPHRDKSTLRRVPAFSPHRRKSVVRRVRFSPHRRESVVRRVRLSPHRRKSVVRPVRFSPHWRESVVRRVRLEQQLQRELNLPRIETGRKRCDLAEVRVPEIIDLRVIEDRMIRQIERLGTEL